MSSAVIHPFETVSTVEVILHLKSVYRFCRERQGISRVSDVLLQIADELRAASDSWHVLLIASSNENADLYARVDAVSDDRFISAMQAEEAMAGKNHRLNCMGVKPLVVASLPGDGSDLYGVLTTDATAQVIESVANAVGSQWSHTHQDEYFDELVVQCKNGVHSERAFVVVGAVIDRDGLSFFAPLFTNSDAEASRMAERIREKGGVPCVLAPRAFTRQG